ncbi:PREDICTED: serpin B3 isoform X3 [Colobus angolensis palliatus]|uniref:Serpin domain-containing protein n=1 Tax=Colobus angolensis palliatus TaxID=336983 RepID=A0A2K5I7Y2_COLAP|nr:PREDICTED: serpin B3 isoform X3 [Colobus angolensis palliatus]
MNSLSEANTKFMFDLFQQFRKSQKNNTFYSPISITSALGMVLLGAKDNTAQQINKVLHFDQVTENTTEKAATHHVDRSGNVHHQFQKLLTELNKSTDVYELKIANKLFGEKTYQFLQEYLDAIKKFYQTSVESVDFAKAPEESRKKINSWVESQTNEKIKNLLPVGTIGNDTTLVLVNAIYFKGQWQNKFNKENTKEEKFWPNKLEEKLTAEKLLEWTSLQNMREAHVDLHLPRFKVEESYKLKDTLRNMGMVDIFSGDADLSGMTGSRGLTVSEVLHKAFVEVTEEGAEATAATVVTGISSPPSTNEEFHCNHPFLFFIRQNKTNSILFFGRFSSP